MFYAQGRTEEGAARRRAPRAAGGIEKSHAARQESRGRTEEGAARRRATGEI
ncbi:hypothetical protein V1224_01455 [Lachnospiraceae bacterium JLR.KK008]